VTGCYATRRPADLAGLPNVVRLVANGQKDDLAALVGPAAGRPSPSSRERSSPSAGERLLRPGYRGRTVALLRVQSGCDERCSYCTIPSTRGPSRSRAPERVLAEALALAAAGFKEITLTGVHLGAYGRDLRPPSSLSALLDALVGLPGPVTFRLSSLEPMDCGAAIVGLAARSDRIAPHFHLPLQHASDRLLGAMRRPYTLAAFDTLVRELRRVLPDAAIGSDVIVGFPGETAEDHRTLTEYLASSSITHLHVFPYSDRPGTEASRFRGRVADSVVRARCEELRRLARGLHRRFAQGQAGRVRRALTIDDGSSAVTDNYLKIRIPAGRGRNERVRVRIGSADPLRGEVEADE
jgi:threonylcarbamoyladenosine tRNA methylthiotransferase MtaB